jgi:IMP dehydrogenase/GMP reductase
MILPDEVTIMAGNVVTKEMTEELIFSGADVIKAWQLIQNHAR